MTDDPFFLVNYVRDNVLGYFTVLQAMMCPQNEVTFV